MDFALNRRRKHQQIVVSDSDSLKIVYPHDMNFYTVPPSQTISLEEFEDYALDRLKVLRIMEYATNKGLRAFSTEWKAFIYEELQKENLKKFLRLIKSKGNTNPNDLDYQARKADHISHYILRLAYCRSAELRRWFLSRELDLFKLRFMELSPQSVIQFFKINNLHYKPISEEEKLELRDDLIKSTSGHFIFETTTFYKVPFLEVLNLIRTRRVLLKKGFAYVPNFEIVVCILTLYRSNLNEYLTYAYKKLPLLDDDRITKLLSNLHEAYTGNDYSEQTDRKEVSLGNLNAYAKQHFPLCMRNIHEVFRSTHHLKHGCRLQYVLFLKAMGLLLDDCLKFWKEEFTKVIDGDKFDKQYAYSVKHAYGTVGRMQSYSAYSCAKIINGNVGAGEHHGCPFKHWDAENLKKKLGEININEKGIEEIVDFAKKGHFQIACGKYFEHTHGQESKNAINHPNQYFDSSFGLVEDDKTGTNTSGASTSKSTKTFGSGKMKNTVDFTF